MIYAVATVLVIFTSFLCKPSLPTPIEHLHSVTKNQVYKDEDCVRRCGNVDIPYPFGIGPSHCYYNDSFAVTCESSSSSSSLSLPTLRKFNLELLRIQLIDSSRYGKITVNIPPVALCVGNRNQRNNTDATSGSVTVPNVSPFAFGLGNYGNVFMSVGCEGYAVLYDDIGTHVTGCTSVCGHDHLSSAVVGESGCYGYNCCHSMIPELKGYTISVSILNNDTSSTPSTCRSAFLIQRSYFDAMSHLPHSMTSVPALLHWIIPDESNEFRFGAANTVTALFFFIQGIIVASLLIICFCVWRRKKTKKSRKESKLRRKYFKERLQEQKSSSTEDAEKIKLFTTTELKKATINFSQDLIVGRGGQGTVYKGMLKNGQVTAVKKSRAMDESEWKPFINEVILLAQIKHIHVVKMLGCCLDTEVPLLVYEFIPNGTLSSHIRNTSGDSPLKSKMRLQIAFEVASAISYLHSESVVPIYHRDIKSSNILLDEKYRAKLADFGISRAISMEQTHLTTSVQGTFGYLDPEYFYSSQYSEKSDVYSFGVVLVELLTGEKPIRLSTKPEDDEEEGEDRTLVVYFISAMNDSTLFNILDPIVSQGFSKEDIMVVANIAKQCLNPSGLERPTMKEVAAVLEGLRRQYLTSEVNDQYIDWDLGECFIPASMETGDASTHVVHDDITTNNKNFYTANESIRLLQTL